MGNSGGQRQTPSSHQICCVGESGMMLKSKAMNRCFCMQGGLLQDIMNDGGIVPFEITIRVPPTVPELSLP
jgi:hypothetical protein